MTENRVKEFPYFKVGQLVHHTRFDYRGVIFEVNATFKGTAEWYSQMALSKPPNDKPWYHVLVHNGMHTTYVAERNLEPDEDDSEINHPMLAEFFNEFENGKYKRFVN
jgi:heat shock protein HspQ